MVVVYSKLLHFFYFHFILNFKFILLITHSFPTLCILLFMLKVNNVIGTYVDKKIHYSSAIYLAPRKETIYFWMCSFTVCLNQVRATCNPRSTVQLLSFFVLNSSPKKNQC